MSIAVRDNRCAIFDILSAQSAQTFSDRSNLSGKISVMKLEVLRVLMALRKYRIGTPIISYQVLSRA